MRFGNLRIGVLGILVLALVMLPAIGACASAPTPPGEEVVIRIANAAILTGPYAGQGIVNYDAVDDYIKYVNETGAIDGVRLEHVWEDVRGETEPTVTFYQTAKAKGIVATTTMATPTALALKPNLERDNIPFCGPAGAKELYTAGGQMFCAYATYSHFHCTTLDWLATKWKDRPKDRPLKAALLAWDNPWGRSPAEDLIKQADKSGVDMVTQEFIPPMSPDVSAALLRIKDSGADVCHVITASQHWVRIIEEADRLGLDTRFVQMGAEYAAEPIKNLGPAAEGLLGIAVFALEEDKDKAVALWNRQYIDSIRGTA